MLCSFSRTSTFLWLRLPCLREPPLGASSPRAAQAYAHSAYTLTSQKQKRRNQRHHDSWSFWWLTKSRGLMRSGKSKDHVNHVTSCDTGQDHMQTKSNKSTHPKCQKCQKCQDEPLQWCFLSRKRDQARRSITVTQMCQATSLARERGEACMPGQEMYGNAVIWETNSTAAEHDCACRFSSEGDRPSNSCKSFAIQRKVSIGT